MTNLAILKKILFTYLWTFVLIYDIFGSFLGLFVSLKIKDLVPFFILPPEVLNFYTFVLAKQITNYRLQKKTQWQINKNDLRICSNYSKKLCKSRYVSSFGFGCLIRWTSHIHLPIKIKIEFSIRDVCETL